MIKFRFGLTVALKLNSLGHRLDLEVVIFVAQLTVAQLVCRRDDWHGIQQTRDLQLQMHEKRQYKRSAKGKG